MASNSPAPEAPFKTGVFSEEGAARSTGEWNPTAETIRPRGHRKHRVMKQRGGFARSSTVLGVGVIAAVGAGGMATAQNKPAVSISLPDALSESLPDVLTSDDDTAKVDESASYAAMGLAGQEVGTAQTGAGEALRSRILQQADQQQAGAIATAKAAAEKAAADKAAEDAKKAAVEAKAAAKQKADEEKKKKERARQEAKKKAEAERIAKLAKSFSLPTSSYNLTSRYGQSGSMWSSGQHTGLDFAAPSGTPVKAVSSGTIKAAGWHNSYGYNITLRLNDGTEVLYAHLSSMAASVGQKVGTGQMIGRVGATGNVTGEHLHLEVTTPGGSVIDPLSWLRSKGLTV
ncbi:M23 family metallopeptidase [Streptomyces albipurpureus]|uniref:M23 family metallopeptidase n=1 Tax=Streptomyces albipurpureus TaxID=2897419 RepID=A0ABT0USG0_9ACTN|nr:M23 family metallopeptidase [Streptomyces sp. CWNU-1]MCM2390909.1 M23 family metallopeptidase [Streptomyces sp. CWNU-1]